MPLIFFNGVLNQAKCLQPTGVRRGGSERSWENRRRDTMSDAVRDLVGAYDQIEDTDSRHDYNIGYSRESLEYTRKWVENNEITTADIPAQVSPTGDHTLNVTIKCMM